MQVEDSLSFQPIMFKRLFSKQIRGDVMKALCPQCEGEINIPEDAVVGEIVTCPDCGSPYEIESVGSEVVIKPAEVEGEDWGE